MDILRTKVYVDLRDFELTETHPISRSLSVDPE